MTVASLENQKSKAKELIAQRDLALKLKSNREFRKLIVEEYIVNEAARYVALSADPVLNAEQRADALAMAQAPGHLKRWLNVICQMGDKAESDMEELDNQIAEARIEEQAEADELAGVEAEQPQAGELQ